MWMLHVRTLTNATTNACMYMMHMHMLSYRRELVLREITGCDPLPDIVCLQV